MHEERILQIACVSYSVVCHPPTRVRGRMIKPIAFTKLFSRFLSIKVTKWQKILE